MKEIPEELLPVIEWWEKDGKQTLVILAVVGLAIGGYYGWKNWREANRVAAADQLMTAYGVEDLEGAVAKYGSSASGAALRLRLAKSYYDAEKYQEALDAYTALKGCAPDGFEDVPEVGAAQCLEALERYDEAVKAFDGFVEARPKSFLALAARIGAARCVAQTGDKAGALARLESVKTDFKDDEAAVAQATAAIELVKRWEKREKVSLSDAAAAVAKELETKAEAPAK